MRFESYHISECTDLVKRILKEQYESLIVTNISIQESFRDDELTAVRFNLSTNNRLIPATIDVKSNGVLDGFVIGLGGALSIRYPTLKDISLEHFDTKVVTDKRAKYFGSDEFITAHITLVNSHGSRLDFEYTSRSLVKAIIHAVVEAFEFLLNLESAIRRLHIAVDDAKRRNRIDIVEDCMMELSQLVRVSNPVR